jgi:drug/metabolite transporter (DMT)-like permease
MVFDRVPPLLLAAFSTVLGGTSFVASRYAVTEGDPAEIAFLRYGFAAVLFFAAARWTGGRWPKIARADMAPNLALGIAMFGGFTWLFTAATQYIPAARAALIVSAMPVIALAFAWALGRERATWTKAAACALAAAGVAVALGDKATGGPEAWKGDAYMILAALIGGAHTVLSSIYVRRYTPLPLIAVQSIAGVAALAAVLAAQGGGALAYSPVGWTAIAWLAVPGGFLSFYFWFKALERIPASRVALCVALNPLSAALGGALVLGETVGPALLAGLVFVAAAIALAARGAEK